MSSELNSRWPEIDGQVERAITDALLKTGDEMKFEFIGELNRSKSGRMYGTHRASAPGQSPATDTADLESSIEVVEETSARIAVQSNSKHAVPLEYGTIHMASRPLWTPVAERMAKQSGQNIATEIGRVK